MAVALQIVTDVTSKKKEEETLQQPLNRPAAKWLYVLSLIISLVALFIALFK